MASKFPFAKPKSVNGHKKQWHFLPSIAGHNPTADDLSNITEEVYEHIRKQMLRKDKEKDLYKFIVGPKKNYSQNKWVVKVDDIIEKMKENDFVVINALAGVVGK
ncbi:hypothetical protein [Pelagibaculum spongiae]|uniref:hypothetical protein n=1 Tax=Pelagibaculum spongiae TaxID=2080658 RepID=UPI00105799AC|nr:hypothetical protein [Pelagibaculum spongiae]